MARPRTTKDKMPQPRTLEDVRADLFRKAALIRIEASEMRARATELNNEADRIDEEANNLIR